MLKIFYGKNLNLYFIIFILIFGQWLFSISAYGEGENSEKKDAEKENASSNTQSEELKKPDQQKQADFIIKPQTESNKNVEEKTSKPLKKTLLEKVPERRALFVFAMAAMFVIMIAVSWSAN